MILTDHPKTGQSGTLESRPGVGLQDVDGGDGAVVPRRVNVLSSDKYQQVIALGVSVRLLNARVEPGRIRVVVAKSLITRQFVSCECGGTSGWVSAASLLVDALVSDQPDANPNRAALLLRVA